LGDEEMRGGFTNAACVVDEQCAEHESPGKGLRPPTVLEHVYVESKPNGKKMTWSRLTCFEVHLARMVGGIGKNLRILVGHFHTNAANMGQNSDRETQVL